MMSPEEAGRKIAQVAAKNTCLTHVGCGYYLVPFYKEMTNGTINMPRECTPSVSSGQRAAATVSWACAIA